MLNRNQLRIISIVLSVALLVVAFMSGIMGLMEDVETVKADSRSYKSFDNQLTTLSENNEARKSGAEDYAESKKAYDAELADYESAMESLSKDEAEFSEDVLEYNSKLIQYSAGKTAMSEGEKALNEGKEKLNEGWKGYNEGKAAFDAGVKEANDKLALYNEGKAAYEAGLKEYEAGLLSYNQLLAALKMMEDRGVPHEQALALVSQQVGITLSDEYITEAKAGLDAAKAGLDEAKAGLDAAEAAIPGAEEQMKQGKAQLDEVYKQLSAGEKELSAAAKKLDSGKSELNKIKNGIGSGKTELGSRSEKIDTEKAELEAKKTELDEKKAELKVYEDTAEKVDRRIESLINDGFGKTGDDIETVIAAAAEKADGLRSDYNKELVSFIVCYGSHILSVLCAATALLLMKKHFGKAKPLSILSVALGAAALIASLICTAVPSIDTLAFAAAVFATVGICLTDTVQKA